MHIAPDAAIDLQLHTIHSDGTWQPEALIDYLIENQFALAAITDHDRVDTAFTVHQLAKDKNFPLLIAAEMTCSWQGKVTDVLCFGFSTDSGALNNLAQAVNQRQRDNTTQVFDDLCQQGLLLADHDASQKAEILAQLVSKPTAQQPPALYDVVEQHRATTTDAFEMMKNAGYRLETNPIPEVVAAAHQDGAVCIIAHPGRTDGFLTYDAAIFDQVLAEAPADGIEVYYPKHTAEQTALYLDYAQQHSLLISAGSDSHNPDRPPIKYRADQARALLERLGIEIA